MVGLWVEREMPRYEHSAGRFLSQFLEGLRRGVLLGARCPSCGRVLVPARGFCEYCYRPTVELVELSGRGRVYSAVVSYISADRRRVEEPQVMGVVELEAPGERPPGWFPGLYHRLCGFSEDDVVSGRAIGAWVRPRWRPVGERRGSLNDIECFEKTGV